MLRIETPKLEGARGGLLNAVDVVKSNDSSIFVTELLEGVADVAPAVIESLGNQVGAYSKTPVPEVENIESVRFSAYTLFEDALLYSKEEQSNAKDTHERRLSFAVEQALESRLLAPKAVDLTPTPGTAVTNARAALGILEQYAAQNSGFLPVIHTNRLGASMLRDLKVDESNWRIHTKQGSPVANGGGYTNDTAIGGVTASDTQAWVYVTTGLVLFEGETISAEGYALKSNISSEMVETNFLAAVAGVVGAVLLGIE